MHKPTQPTQGGPAHPTNDDFDCWGVSRRDYFAAAALPALIARWIGPLDPYWLADQALDIADHVLAAAPYCTNASQVREAEMRKNEAESDLEAEAALAAELEAEPEPRIFNPAQPEAPEPFCDAVAREHPIETELRIRRRIFARARDLVHLLEFATITTPTPGDAAQARAALGDLRAMLAQIKSPAPDPNAFDLAAFSRSLAAAIARLECSER